jgi:hypothetical protein
VETTDMNSSVQAALEDYLKRISYRRVDLPYGRVWVPPGCADEWPVEGAKCVSVLARPSRRSASGVNGLRYGVAVYSYYRASDGSKYWGYTDLVLEGLQSADAAACEALARAVSRALPACIEGPTVWHALGEAAFLPVEEGC